MGMFEEKRKLKVLKVLPIVGDLQLNPCSQHMDTLEEGFMLRYELDILNMKLEILEVLLKMALGLAVRVSSERIQWILKT